MNQPLNTSLTAEKKLQVLSDIAEQLNQNGITWALGGSAMLYFHHVVSDFHDLDILTDCRDALKVRKILRDMGTLHDSSNGKQYRTEYFFEFTVSGVEIDIIAGFAIIKDGIAYDCSLNAEDITDKVTVNGQKIPLHSVQVWRRYYELMDRQEKVRIIDSAADRLK